MRLIDADKLYPDCLTKRGTLAISQSQIANAPTVDISKEVWNQSNALLEKRLTYLERPQGEWTIIDDTVCECPRCKHQQTFLLSPKESNVNFCERCGAYLRGKEE